MRSAILILVPFVLVGCQTEPKPMQHSEAKAVAPKCKGNDTEEDCRIMVDITTGPDGTCIVAVREKQKTVGFKRGKEEKLIVWQIDGAPPGDYQFTSAGIAPKKGFEDAWDKNFNGGKSYGRTFEWRNKNKEPGSYEYKVIVVNEDGVTCLQDPRIVNQ